MLQPENKVRCITIGATGIHTAVCVPNHSIPDTHNIDLELKDNILEDYVPVQPGIAMSDSHMRLTQT